MSVDNESFESLSEKLAAQERQIALLTKRVFQLEQRAPGLSAVAPSILNQPVFADPIPSQPEKAPLPPPLPDILPSPEPDWESKFGTNWLNRAGVLLLVIGVALFLGYSLTFLGPAGKIGIGVLSGALLLGTGYWFQAKEQYRVFALGLLAGGFAILYFTAYASYAIAAARIISNDIVGSALQAAVALAAVWQATKLPSEKAAILAFLGAFLAFAHGGDSTLLHWGLLPLTLAGLWLSTRQEWALLPFFILVFAWGSWFPTSVAVVPSGPWGKAFAWVYWVLLEASQIFQQRRWNSWDNALWILANASFFLTVTFTNTSFKSDSEALPILLLFAGAQVAASLLRIWREIRDQALSEALAVALLAAAATVHWMERDNLLLLMIWLALALSTLIWNRRAPSVALIIAGETLLAFTAAIIMIVLPETKLLGASPLRIHLALPQALILTVSLFAAGRWLSVSPWPSWAALFCTAVITLITIPKTLGTVVLALEAILALAAGFYLGRRPIRLGGLALFCFSVLKVFFYDLSELDTLPRIFSFIVLGLLLIGASWAYSRFREQVEKLL